MNVRNLSGTRRILQFGPFEFRVETGELSKLGVRLEVQAKPILILRTLLERAGDVVSREELCRRLWPDGTHVDFESGLNTAVNRLRTALADSAEGARYIETLPRIGYRFICPVEEKTAPEGRTRAAVQEPSKPADAPPAEASKRNSRFCRSNLYVMAVAAAASVALMALVLSMNHPVLTSEQPLHFHQLTYGTGVLVNGRFLPGDKGAVYTALSKEDSPSVVAMRLDTSGRAIRGR